MTDVGTKQLLEAGAPNPCRWPSIENTLVWLLGYAFKDSDKVKPLCTALEAFWSTGDDVGDAKSTLAEVLASVNAHEATEHTQLTEKDVVHMQRLAAHMCRTPCYGSVKYDGTSLGKDADSVLYGRNQVVGYIDPALAKPAQKGAQIPTYQKTKLNRVLEVDVGRVQAKILGDVLGEHDSEGKNLVLSVPRFVLYGELMCNHNIYSYTALGLPGKWFAYGVNAQVELRFEDSCVGEVADKDDDVGAAEKADDEQADNEQDSREIGIAKAKLQELFRRKGYSCSQPDVAGSPMEVCDGGTKYRKVRVNFLLHMNPLLAHVLASDGCDVCPGAPAFVKGDERVCRTFRDTVLDAATFDLLRGGHEEGLVLAFDFRGKSDQLDASPEQPGYCGGSVLTKWKIGYEHQPNAERLIGDVAQCLGRVAVEESLAVKRLGQTAAAAQDCREVVRRLVEIVTNKRRKEEVKGEVLFLGVDEKPPSGPSGSGGATKKGVKQKDARDAVLTADELEREANGALTAKWSIGPGESGKLYNATIKSARTKYDDCSKWFAKTNGFEEYVGLIAKELLDSGDVVLADVVSVVGKPQPGDEYEKMSKAELGAVKEKMQMTEHVAKVRGFLQKEYDRYVKKNAGKS